jgi:hypothetical protein
MPFQFRCPQGHVLQGDASQVGQLFQCPMCGSSFLVPPPEMGPVAQGGFFQAPGNWPAANAPMPSFPPQGPMQGMMPPANMPMMHGGPMPAGPYPMQAAQPFAFGPAPVNPPAAPAAPADAPQQPQAAASPSDGDKPKFDLGFDPNAKASLPYELPGHGDAEADTAAAAPLPGPLLPAPSFPAAGFPLPSFPAASFSGESPPAADFPVPSMPATFEPSAGGQDFLQSAPAAAEETAAPQGPPKVLHIRCPSGHLVKATSDLLGKNGRCPACKKTFELRYEDSVEFQRRTAKIMQREEIKIGRAWLAWGFLAAFGLFVGLVALMLYLSR